MCRKLICAIALVLVPVGGAKVKAEVFIDNFDTPHMYYDPITGTADVTGTIWDDFIGWMPGETVDALNASIDRPGQLFLSSTGAEWAEDWNPLGPFLFKIVEGDFIATVRVTDYAGTPDAVVFHNDCGLMARAFLDDAGPGEDWVTIDYFPIWGIGNMVWETRDNVRDEAWSCHNNKQWDLDAYLRLERSGNNIHLYTSPDGENWTEMACSPKTRDDFAGLPLMVGLRHATYSTEQGYAAFDDFRLETIVKFKAFGPVPADGAKSVDPDINLIWAAGAKAEFHDVYFGTNFDDVNDADTTTAGIYRGRQNLDDTSYVLPEAPLEFGQACYWRIDEVNDAHPEKIWKGDTWSFTVISLEAFNPNPPDGAECVPVDIDLLTWSAGAQATQHWVYFGTTDPPPFKTVRTVASYDPPALAHDTLYYWRIDEKRLPQTWPGEVWTFRTLESIPIADPTLVGWWKLDGGCGESDIVVDSSGYNHHGTLIGGAQWVPGYEGGALEFDGRDDYVDLPIGSVIGSLTNSTFMVWLDSEPGGSWVRAFDFGTDDPNVYMCLGPRWWFMDDMYFAITTSGFGGQTLVQPTAFDIETGWQHVAVTIDADNDTMILYYNGTELARNASATLSPQDLGNTTNNWLGRSHDPENSYYLGSMDDFRIYDCVLSQAEIEKAMLGDPRLAWNPKPANGSTVDIEHATPLSWSPGDNAAEHDVYFGTDEDAVANADTSTTGIYRGRRDPNTYTPPETLEFGRRYYWRIDEYNTDTTLTEGRVWSFTVADYLSVDDFESYGGVDAPGVPGSRVWYAWQDGFGWTVPAPGSHGNGTGAVVDLETGIVGSGAQSLQCDYDNDGTFQNIFGEPSSPYYSEAERTFEPAQDWTRYGVRALALSFRGLPPPAGSFDYNPVTGIYTMTARCADITGTSDQLHLAFKRLSGFGSVEAQVLSVSDSAAGAKAGVMIRETLDPGSANALVAVTPGNGVTFQVRTIADGDTITVATEADITAPHWVRLERGAGNSFTAYHSADGSAWDPLGGPTTVGMVGDLYMGLALTSNNVNVTCVAQFSDVTTTGTGDWQSQDIGIASNVAEKLYVKLEDSLGNSEVVEHPDPDAVLADTWQDWNISLQDVANAGVNTGSIKKMSVRVGDKGDPTPGGTGTLYIDDIRLYRPTCTPSVLKPAGDCSDDCVVDYFDLEIMAVDWLVGDEIIATTDPGAANLVGYWKLDDGSGTTADDSSVNSNNGAVHGDPKWVTGYDGGALDFDGYNDYVELPIGSLINSLTNSTFAMWVDFSNAGGAWQRIFDFGSDTTAYMFLTPRMGTADAMRFAITVEGGGAPEQMATAPSTLPSGWHHVAVTINAADDTITLYLDGAVVAQNTQATLSPSDLGVTTNNWLGRSQYTVDAFYRGLIDDFRIYSRALTQAEIGYLADKTSGDGQLYIPVPSPAELYEAEPQGSRAVNFMDFAVLAGTWLDELLWP